MKKLALAVILALCAPAWAQTVLNISDSTVEQEFLMVRYEVDHGSTPTAVQIDLALTVSTPGGLEASIFPNWDAYVAGTGADVRGDDTAGTLSLMATTAARAGVHPVIIMVGSDGSFGDASTFVGTITFSVNGVTQTSQGKHEFLVDGLVHSLCGVFADCTTINAVGTTSYTITLDAGPAVQTFSVRVLTQSTAAAQVELLDTTGASTQVLATYTPVMMMNVVGQGTYPVTGSGTMRITLRAQGGVPGNYFIGRFFLPSTVSVTNASRATGSLNPGGGDGGGKDGGCATGGAGALPLAPATLALFRRRRER